MQFDPKTLKDTRINEVFVESPSRLLLHLRDGRAVAIRAGYHQATLPGDVAPSLDYELVNP